jgi:hypothetical protein
MAEAPCMLDLPPASERPWQRTRVRSPRGDESYVAVPSLPEAAPLAAMNGDRLATTTAMIQGRSLAVLREWTRREALTAAAEYTADLVGTSPADLTRGLPEPADARIYVGGHQPALFHPGVWVKNFAVAGLAKADRGIGLNLVVDNDTMSASGIRVPAGDREHPRAEIVLFDEPRSIRPWEEARVVDRHLFESFPKRVTETMAGWGFEPMLGEFWTAAAKHAEKSDRLADCLTAARCQWERRWGNGNLELPLSRLCRLDSFLWFASHLLAHLPRFHTLYNQVLHEYRTVNRLRSRTHPVPDLREEDGWFEAPFWIWHAEDAMRQRLFARQEGDEIRLSNGAQVIASLPLTPAKEACCAVEVLRKLQDEGWRLRTRALTTTLFSRLCLADLFVHGLGGAIYDEMTDRLITRFFRLPAPGFLMLSATVRLPLPAHEVERDDERRLRRQLRELDFHSDRHLPPIADVSCAALVDEKTRLIAEQQAIRAGAKQKSSPRRAGAASSGRARYFRLKEINRRLSESTQTARQRLVDELSRTVEQLSANAVLEDREYAYCLYPPEKLRRFMDHVCSEFES